METTETNKKRFRVEKHEHHGGGLFELEITTKFHVIDNRTGQIIMTFDAGSSTHYTGQWSDESSWGVSHVEISEDETEVLVQEHGRSEPRRFPLPH